MMFNCVSENLICLVHDDSNEQKDPADLRKPTKWRNDVNLE